jgi:hypothetical protein
LDVAVRLVPDPWRLTVQGGGVKIEDVARRQQDVEGTPQVG